MALKAATIVVALAISLAPVCARSDDGQRTAWFDKGLSLDLAGASEKAYAAFLKAAEAGMVAAQFNVAVMLDSGRGIPIDRHQAAIWYARAAARGDKRATYNLALLYETGVGVPQNEDVARSLFTASRLPAAREHLSTVAPLKKSAGPLTPPSALFPGDGSSLRAPEGLELVWSSTRQFEPTQFYVELVSLDSSKPLFAGFAGGTSIFVPSDLAQGTYAWRAVSLTKQATHYAASEWAVFRVICGHEACES